METKVSKNFNEVEGKTSPVNEFITQLKTEMHRNENDYKTTVDAIKEVVLQMTGTKYDNEVLKNLLLRAQSAQRNIRTLDLMIDDINDVVKLVTQEALNDE